MNKYIKHITRFVSTLLLLGFSFSIRAQEINLDNGVVIDKAVHNFGDILLSDGPVECSFIVKNNGSKPIVIYNVVTSCGCTEAKWTRNPIKPGEKGKITVVYTNDEGAYAFNKSVTAYISNVKKAVVLRIKGKTHNKSIALEESYPLKFGPIGLERNSIICGNMTQGQMKSNLEMIANLSNFPIKVTFSNITEELELKVQPNPIPARSTARLHFCIKASEHKWGNNDYTAIPLANGQVYEANNGDTTIVFKAFTIQDFSGASPDDIKKGPNLAIELSSYEFGQVRKGNKIKACFQISNSGKEDLIIYKIDSDMDGFKHNNIPVLRPNESYELRLEFDTCCISEGDFLALVTLTTNAPANPYANLFVSGTVIY